MKTETCAHPKVEPYESGYRCVECQSNVEFPREQPTLMLDSLCECTHPKSCHVQGGCDACDCHEFRGLVADKVDIVFDQPD